MSGKIKSKVCKGVDEYFNTGACNTVSNIIGVGIVGGYAECVYDRVDSFYVHTISDISQKTFLDVADDINRSWCEYILNEYRGTGLYIQFPEISRVLILDPASAIRDLKKQDYCICAIALQTLLQTATDCELRCVDSAYMDVLLDDYGYTTSDFGIDPDKVLKIVPVVLTEEEQSDLILELERIVASSVAHGKVFLNVPEIAVQDSSSK